MVSTAGTAVSVFPEWRFPNAGLRGHGGRNIHYGFYWIYDCILRKHSLILFIQKITASYFWVTGERSIWFIALIVPLYIFYPLIYNKILIKYNVRKIWLIMFGISALIFLCSYLGKIYFFSHYKLYEIAITRIPVFLLGCSLGKYVYGNKVINKYVLVISLLVAFAGVSGFLYEKIDVINTLRIPYLLIAPCLALWLCILLDKIKLTIFNQILSLFGEVSLELYLSHLVIREIARRIHLWDTNNFSNFCKYVFFVALASYTVSKIVSILFYYLMKRKKLEVRCRQ